jgi:uncharacterized membrane protein YhaH (DUF805 family)
VFYYLFQPLNNYANFKDRTSRKAYWMFVLSLFLVNLVSLILIMFLGFISQTMHIIGVSFNSALTLLFFIPGVALKVRRFHDVRKGISGWWLLLLIVLSVVFIGAFLAFSFVAFSHAMSVAAKALPEWFLPVFFLLLLCACLPSITMIIIESLKSSPESNRFGPPANDSKPSDYQFVFTSSLKKCAIAFIILFVSLCALNLVLKNNAKSTTDAGQATSLITSLQKNNT